MKISIIIPTYQEADIIGKLVHHLFEYGGASSFEILVIDGESTDGTVEAATAAGAQVFISPKKGRASQMHFGAKQAKGTILYFLHADAFPPSTFLQSIEAAVNKGFDFGHFRQKIMSKKTVVSVNSFLSRLPGLVSSGGDQSLFITAKFYNKLGGFNEALTLMEDYDLVKRARKIGTWVKIPTPLQVVDRKYEYNSFLRVNLANAMVFTAYKCGVAPNRLKRWYKAWIKGPRYQELH